MEAMDVQTFDKAKDLVMRIIIAADDPKLNLIDEAINYINEEFMEASQNKNVSNQSELN